MSPYQSICAPNLIEIGYSSYENYRIYINHKK